MFSRLFLATALVAATSTLALAQDAPPPKPAPSAPGMAGPDAGTPPPPPPSGPGMHGMKGMHGPMGWRRHGGRGGKGFTLSLGDGGMLKVDCGDEPLRGCIEAAQPLLDQLDGGMMGDEPSDEMQQDEGMSAPGAEPRYPAEPPAPAPGAPKGDQ